MLRILSLVIIITVINTSTFGVQIRKVQNTPTGFHYFVVKASGEYLILQDAYGNLKDVYDSTYPRFEMPFYTALIDPVSELLTVNFTTYKSSAECIVAEYYQTNDLWLATDYATWDKNSVGDKIFALKVNNWNSITDRYDKLRVIDTTNHQIIHTFDFNRSGILHPEDEKMYTIDGYSANVFSTQSYQIIKNIEIIGDDPENQYEIGFEGAIISSDGSYIYGSLSGGIFVIDTTYDVLYNLIPVAYNEFRLNGPVVFSADGFELFGPLTTGNMDESEGYVAAIDVATNTHVRSIKVSDTPCTSVAVIGNKLFAACYDGVYVIDIDQWRQENQAFGFGKLYAKANYTAKKSVFLAKHYPVQSALVAMGVGTGGYFGVKAIKNKVKPATTKNQSAKKTVDISDQSKINQQENDQMQFTDHSP